MKTISQTKSIKEELEQELKNIHIDEECICRKCGPSTITYIKRGSHIGAFCSKCLTYIHWIKQTDFDITKLKGGSKKSKSLI